MRSPQTAGQLLTPGTGVSDETRETPVVSAHPTTNTSTTPQSRGEYGYRLNSSVINVPLFKANSGMYLRFWPYNPSLTLDVPPSPREYLVRTGTTTPPAYIGRTPSLGRHPTPRTMGLWPTNSHVTSMRSFGDEDSIFVNLDRLNPNTQTYQPDSLPEREEELNQLHSTLKPAAMGSTPLNAFVFGPTGQGKTVGVKLKTNQLQSYANDNGLDLHVVHVRCKGMDKSYHVMTHLLKALREKRYGPGEELPSGYQKKTLLSMIYRRTRGNRRHGNRYPRRNRRHRQRRLHPLRASSRRTRRRPTLNHRHHE